MTHLLDTATLTAVQNQPMPVVSEEDLAFAQFGNFADLCAAEPDLLLLESEVKDRAGEMISTEDAGVLNAWYGRGVWRYDGFKEKMASLVGYDGRNPALANAHCYQIAYRHLFNLLETLVCDGLGIEEAE